MKLVQSSAKWVASSTLIADVCSGQWRDRHPMSGREILVGPWSTPLPPPLTLELQQTKAWQRIMLYLNQQKSTLKYYSIQYQIYFIFSAGGIVRVDPELCSTGLIDVFSQTSWFWEIMSVMDDMKISNCSSPYLSSYLVSSGFKLFSHSLTNIEDPACPYRGEFSFIEILLQSKAMKILCSYLIVFDVKLKKSQGFSFVVGIDYRQCMLPTEGD